MLRAVNLACGKPKDLGHAAEMWTRRALAGHVRSHCQEAGYASLLRATQTTVQRILSERSLRPEKIRYYLERRDPEFERKMREILLVCKEVYTTEQNVKDGRKIITVSVDEKSGVQAVADTAPDLPAVPDKYPTIAQDHKYVRMGTVSIPATLATSYGTVNGLPDGEI